MQIRRASFPTETSLPPCPFDHEKQQCLHRHGHYKRYAQPTGPRKTPIPRFLCKFTGKTVSVLPETFLPYRSINVPDVQEHFDQLTSTQEQIPPAQNTTDREHAVRAWERFSEKDRTTRLPNRRSH